MLRSIETFQSFESSRNKKSPVWLPHSRGVLGHEIWDIGKSQTTKAFINQEKELEFILSSGGKDIEGFRWENDMIWFVFLKYLGLLYGE